MTKKSKFRMKGFTDFDRIANTKESISAKC